MAKKQYNVKTSAVAATERRARKYGVAGGSGGVGTYIDVAGDVAGKLDRGVFESMFERVVTGTDDDGNEKWYIRAKATLVSVGDVVAYGVSDITGGAGGSSTLANLKDVLLGTLKDGDVIKWDASLGKWVNSQGGGGLDEDSLAAYLTANNYVTEATLGDYVTVGTGQTISGKKTFGADDTFFTRRATINGDFSGPENCPHIMWHVPNQEFTKMLMDVYGNLHLLWGGATDLNDYRGLTVRSIAKYGGTSSQFLKADGSVDGNNYIKCYDGNVKLEWLWGSNPTHIVGFESNSSTAMRVYDGNALRNFTNAVNKAGDTMTGDLYTPHLLVGITQSEVLNSWPIYNNQYWHIIVGGKPAHYGGSINIMRTADSQQSYISWIHKNQDHFGIGAASNSNEIEIKNYLGGINIASTGAFTYNGNTIWHAGNDGSGSGLDADLLDGRHCYDYVQKFYSLVSPDESITWQDWLKRNGNNVGLYTRDGWSWAMSGNINVGWETINAESYSALVCRQGNLNSAWGMSAALFIPVYPEVKIMYLVRAVTASEGVITGQSSLRFADYDTIVNGNVASATKLHTARTLYVTSYNSYRSGDGVAFDGTGDVTLKLPNSITASDWFRSYGASGWYNESYGGGIYMEDATWVRVFNGKSFYCASNILAGGDVTAYSDARLKSDICPLTNRGFIEPKTYIKDGKRSIGFLAQDVMAIYPELVTDTGGADHWLALNYGNLVAVLEAQIIDHEERIKRLEERV